MSYPSFGWFLDNEIKIYRVIKKSSKDVQGKIERDDLYQKKFRSIDGLESIICGLK